MAVSLVHKANSYILVAFIIISVLILPIQASFSHLVYCCLYSIRYTRNLAVICTSWLWNCESITLYSLLKLWYSVQAWVSELYNTACESYSLCCFHIGLCHPFMTMITGLWCHTTVGILVVSVLTACNFMTQKTFYCTIIFTWLLGL